MQNANGLGEIEYKLESLVIGKYSHDNNSSTNEKRLFQDNILLSVDGTHQVNAISVLILMNPLQ